MTGPEEQHPAPGTTDGAWSRLSPRMLLIHPLRAIKDLLPGLLPLLVVGNVRSDGGGEWWNLAAGVLVLVLAVVTWATTTFRVADGRVQQRKGLLSRETLTIPVDRVRSVDLQASPVHRVLGLMTARIGTGAAGGKPLLLDGLTTAQAQQLRHDLLARAAAAPAPAAETDEVVDGSVGTAGRTTGSPEVPPGAEDEGEILVRFVPGWVRFAPLSASGLLTALAIIGFVSQLASQILDESDWLGIDERAAQVGVVTLSVIAVVGAIGLVVASAIVTYVLAYWGHQVSRPAPDRLHVRRGLLTVRSTTLDLGRVRGVSLSESLLMRPARGGSLKAVTTGLGGRAADAGPGEGSGTSLLPPAPVAVARELTARLLGDRVLETPLRRHGRAPRRRRWTRALQVGLAVLAPPAALVAWQGWSWWWALPFALPLLLAPLLAEDRWRNLGHAVVPRAAGEPRLVTRRGSLDRRTVVLDGDGVVGWVLRETFWQRRAGVATLRAATAAGAQHYDVVDLPADDAWGVAAAVTPPMFGAEAPRARHTA